jgi:hypothetical protein
MPPGSRQFREVVTWGSGTTHRKVAEKPWNTYQMRHESARFVGRRWPTFDGPGRPEMIPGW